MIFVTACIPPSEYDFPREGSELSEHGAGPSLSDLVVWQQALSLVSEVYWLTQEFPSDERHGLTAQIRRAAVSVPSNIAEGQGRCSTGELRQFLGHARGSLLELETQLLIANNLGYLTGATSAGMGRHIEKVGQMLNALLNSLRDR
ncbi:MAG TPA: four helix bundle protein [Terriglobales bacterium]|nr:four helix bundle protein [Terriglobales bacterium]